MYCTKTSKYLGLLLCLFFGTQLFSQTKADDKTYTVAFYNLENLFDTINDPNTKDEEFTPEGDNQWGTERYNNKLNNLAKVISSMNNGKGPDVLGVCEVENSKVLKDLINTPALKKLGYGIVHQESRDQRGIDVSLLYKEDVLPWISFTTLPVPLPDSVPPTRDIMLIQTEIDEQPINFIVCHFPSRSEGKEKSEYKRVEAGKVVKHFVDSLLTQNPKENILIMGDFNDEPGDTSIKYIVGAKEPHSKINNTECYNLMASLKNEGLGSYKYRDEWNMLDQIIISGNLYLGNNGLGYVNMSAGIFAEDWMKQTEPKYLGSPLRTFGGRKYLAGYSDHFPVYINIKVIK
jgi:endonuclease/exonuclease/phosphatase family metal-dependent hydrolase